MTLLHNISRTLQRRRNITWHALGYDTIVRPETPADYSAIASLTQTAFNSTAEVTLINTIRQQYPQHIALVAEQHGNIVGHILFSPVSLASVPEAKLMALAPMAVSNVLQHQGIGSALVRAGLELCRQQGVAAVVVLGHPGYYPRFGFNPASQFNIRCPWQAPDEAFMLLPLNGPPLDGNNAKVLYPAAFNLLKTDSPDA
jgi:putative acetyltransferase